MDKSGDPNIASLFSSVRGIEHQRDQRVALSMSVTNAQILYPTLETLTSEPLTLNSKLNLNTKQAIPKQ